MISRREMLYRGGCGFGALALNELLTRSALAGSGAVDQLHHRARVKRVIFLFMHGGPSHVDTFDHKPLLTRDDGKTLPFDLPPNLDAVPKLMKSPWKFARHGASGLWCSELLPNLAECVDDLCVIRSMHSRGQSHGQAVGMLNTGSDNLPRPSVGAWVSYGLGSENNDLPSFIALGPSTSHGGPRNYGSSFLPARHQATAIGQNGDLQSGEIPFLNAPRAIDQSRRSRQLGLLQQINHRHLERSGPDAQIEGTIAAYELAFRMQLNAPEVFDIESEPASIQKMYGIDQKPTEKFGRQCLLARRLVESGVRFVQISTGNVWDQHGNLRSGHEKNALATDRPVAGLLRDLKQRGLLEDTLVIWSGEFGRTPVVQGKDGRDHNPQGFTAWMAGGGLKRGFAYGETDEYGYYAVNDRVHMHDLHATILHLLGIDHERLTYRYAGREFRLTDVYGRVVKDLLA